MADLQLAPPSSQLKICVQKVNWNVLGDQISILRFKTFETDA